MEQEFKPVHLFGWVVAGVVSVAVVLGTLFGFIALGKKFSIWTREQNGRAALAEAQFSKQVKIEEAKSNLEAEKLNAESEVVRAKGAAESIEIEGGELTENYIRYLWVRQQSSLNDKTVIYIPTEAGLPLLEAGKR